VLLGSDYPYDMGMYDLVDHVRSLGISDADKTTILGTEAEKLLHKAKAHSRATP
jgi:predicted TIM-barrel fold metal-dependent hydrolase